VTTPPEIDLVQRLKRLNWRWRLAFGSAMAVLFLTACGGSADPAVTAEAEANQGELAITADISRTEMLDVHTGEITSLGDVVTGDRAVLAWYWAPH